jgi:hypothetical protein
MRNTAKRKQNWKFMAIKKNGKRKNLPFIFAKTLQKLLDKQKLLWYF